jgi:O-phosphoseryl-tRNA(Cys) synthetase
VFSLEFGFHHKTTGLSERQQTKWITLETFKLTSNVNLMAATIAVEVMTVITLTIYEVVVFQLI